jgi:flagellar hook assembly protein FlgD
VLDARGRQVAVLVDGFRAAGEHTVHWDGRDSSGNVEGSGLYLLEIETPAFRQVRKMLLVR